jgi:hypothetical protein
VRIRLSGASYAFALTDGSWGALMPNSINTSEGAVPLPGEPVLFLVGARYNGRLYMAGQGHDSGSAWLWDGAWRVVSSTHGVSPCAFGATVLYVATSGDGFLAVRLWDGSTQHYDAPIGSQGIRYIDDLTPITGDATYRDGELFEWTRRGDVTVGQGHEGGCLINGRVLEPGDRRFIRFERNAEQLAIAMVDQPGNAAVLIWMTRPELVSLPFPGTPVPVPVPQPIPEPSPMPYEPNTPQTWNNDELYRRVVAELAAVRSSDSPEYWIGVIRAASQGSDWGYWVNRIHTGDGAWKLPAGPAPTPQPAPSPAPSPDPGLLARIAELEAQLATAKDHPGYDEMMAMVAQAEAAFEGAQHGRAKSHLGPDVAAHLTWRLMFEGYTVASLVEEARERAQ